MGTVLLNFQEDIITGVQQGHNRICHNRILAMLTVRQPACLWVKHQECSLQRSRPCNTQILAYILSRNSEDMPVRDIHLQMCTCQVRPLDVYDLHIHTRSGLLVPTEQLRECG